MTIPSKDIRLVDLKKSGFNEAKSDPKKGKFHFDNSEYHLHTESGAIDKITVAKEFGFYFKWGTTNPRDLQHLKYLGYDYLTLEDGIWPKPIELNADGHFVNFDAPAMKVPIQKYIDTQKKNIAKSENAGKAKRREFENMTEQLEPGSAMSSEDLDKYLGR